jgi:hypothetical protein
MGTPNKLFSKGHGFDDLVTEFRNNKGKSTVFVGFLRSSGAHKKKSDDKSPVLTVATVAYMNEYGSGNIPERSFMRSALFDNRKKIKKTLAKLAKNVLDGKMSGKKALGLVGASIATMFRKKIQDGVAPANAPSTIAAKGSDHTLIDIGQMRDSIDYEVRGK